MIVVTAVHVNISVGHRMYIFLNNLPFLANILYSWLRLSRLVCHLQVGLLCHLQIIDERTQQWWTDNWQGKLKYLEKNLLKCRCVHQRFHIDYPETELGLHGENPPSNHLSYGVAFSVNNSLLLYHKRLCMWSTSLGQASDIWYLYTFLNPAMQVLKCHSTIFGCHLKKIFPWQYQTLVTNH